MPYNPDGSFFSIHENEIVLNKRNGHTHNGENSTLVYISPGSITKDKLAPGVIPRPIKGAIQVLLFSQPGPVTTQISGRYYPLEDETIGGISATLDTLGSGICTVDLLYKGSKPTQTLIDASGNKSTINPWELQLNPTQNTNHYNRGFPPAIALASFFDPTNNIMPDYIQVQATPSGGEQNLVVTIWKV